MRLYRVPAILALVLAGFVAQSAPASAQGWGRECRNPGHWDDINSYAYGYRGCGWYAGRWWPGGYAGYRVERPRYGYGWYDDGYDDGPRRGCRNPKHWDDINSYPYGYRGCGWYAGRWWPGGYAGYRVQHRPRFRESVYGFYGRPYYGGGGFRIEIR